MGWQGKKGTGIFIKLMTGHSGETKIFHFPSLSSRGADRSFVVRDS